jgi:hypothetical protein
MKNIHGEHSPPKNSTQNNTGHYEAHMSAEAETGNGATTSYDAITKVSNKIQA